jgi:hypothetical protein
MQKEEFGMRNAEIERHRAKGKARKVKRKGHSDKGKVGRAYAGWTTTRFSSLDGRGARGG